MADSDTNVLVFLREQFARAHAQMDNLTSAVSDLSRRVTSLEAGVALLRGDFADQTLRLDRLENRLDRIERRLDIVSA